MKKMTKGQLEAAISEAIIKFEVEYMGRGSEETRTYIINDMILIRLKGVLTSAEKQLARGAEGKLLVKRMRVQLLEDSRKLLESLIREITGIEIISLHTDISTKTGERIIIFTLEKNIEETVGS